MEKDSIWGSDVTKRKSHEHKQMFVEDRKWQLIADDKVN